jgi:hypothetical protein
MARCSRSVTRPSGPGPGRSRANMLNNAKMHRQHCKHRAPLGPRRSWRTTPERPAGSIALSASFRRESVVPVHSGSSAPVA